MKHEEHRPTHAEIPTESKPRSVTDMGNYRSQTSASLKQHCTKISHENSMCHTSPPETMTNGKFRVQKIVFDHPSVSLGD